MRYKSEAFVRFKEFRLEVHNQIRGGEHLSGEFLDYLKEKGIVSQWTFPGTPQLNGVAKRRNRILLDMIRSMMSFTELLLSFWGYVLETAARLLNIAPSKIVAQTPYQIWHDKSASYKYLRVWGSPAYVKRLVGDKLDSRSSLSRFIGYPKETTGYYFYGPSEQKVFVSRNAVFLERGFPTDTRRDELLLEESSEAPQLNAGTSSAPNVSTHNVPILRRSARVPQPPERDLYRSDEGIHGSRRRAKVCYLQRSIYGLKQASRSWNIRFDEIIRGYDFVKNDFDPCVYKKVSGSSVLFLVLYVDDILLIRNDIKMLGDTKAWLSTQFSMKDLGEASYILGIKIFRDRSKRILGMTQNSYVEKVLKRFEMEHSKRGFLPSRYQACAGEAHWTAVKTILKYLRKTKDVFLVYGGGELILEGFSDASFQSDDDDAKSQSGFVFKLNGGVVAWKSSKQDTTANSTTEAEYIAASEAAKEAVWMKTTSKSWVWYLALPSQ
ncbi:Retrovirus-related Pol polyprotein from transposon TNT 1-94 [Sesamum angolense]|uniref:Retrovirus-related Pol polyprotein from transposon TNT 1-94 n=1 Tax=Sesamum angolense TaxID=2727404 RepID=A0AAE1T3A2_9LAMI|nr:Retrovirus-related Pol polyprotein from transposon TNT 1-94 [Sesamum angolense]